MTITLMPRTAYVSDRFARVCSAVRGAVRHPLMRPQEPVVNEGRWATLPGEYAGPWDAPVDRALPPLIAPGLTEMIGCAGHGPAIVHLAGRWAGRIAFEGSMDGVTWSCLILTALDSGAEATETDRPGLWRTLPGHPVRFLRLRVMHLSTGAVHASVATVPVIAQSAQGFLDTAA